MSFVIHENNGVPFLVSDLLPCPHAFSTRAGGVSTLPHLRSLNVGENRGDDPQNPKINVSLLCQAAFLPQNVVSALQIHSADIMYVDRIPPQKPSLDGFYTDKKDITLCVKVADCLPVLLCDPRAGLVAALHAGWRGSASGIVKNGVSLLRERGSDPKDLLCAIGPSIGKCCFEVREDFISEFSSLAGRDAANRFIEERGGSFYADLKEFNRSLLLSCGVLPQHIDVSPDCTCCRPDLFFSHRATRGVRGTMGAFISLGFSK